MRSTRSMAETASFFASRMPLVNQQRSPHTSCHSTFTVPSLVRIVARSGRSSLSNTMDEIDESIGLISSPLDDAGPDTRDETSRVPAQTPCAAFGFEDRADQIRTLWSERSVCRTDEISFSLVF